MNDSHFRKSAILSAIVQKPGMSCRCRSGIGPKIQWLGGSCQWNCGVTVRIDWLPSGELTFCHGKSPFLMGKSTISMAIFHCYVSSPEGTIVSQPHHCGFLKEP